MTLSGDQIRERIRVRRSVVADSDASLCRRHGISHQRWSAWMKKLPDIELRTLALIAEMLSVTPGWLLDGELSDALPKPRTLPDSPI